MRTKLPGCQVFDAGAFIAKAVVVAATANRVYVGVAAEVKVAARRVAHTGAPGNPGGGGAAAATEVRLVAAPPRTAAADVAGAVPVCAL
jgi:hypothetical protein